MNKKDIAKTMLVDSLGDNHDKLCSDVLRKLDSEIDGYKAASHSELPANYSEKLNFYEALRNRLDISTYQQTNGMYP